MPPPLATCWFLCETSLEIWRYGDLTKPSTKDWSDIERLRARAFGGGDVAVRPDHDDDDWWPRGPLLPGVENLVSQALSAIEHADVDLKLFFLIGGAGNGKSYAARELAKKAGVEIAGEAAGVAKRIYENTSGAIDFVLLNDATIASREEYGAGQSFALSSDLMRWVSCAQKKPLVAFCCVNRGIIIDELRVISKNSSSDQSDFISFILNWLDGGVYAELNAIKNGGIISKSDDGIQTLSIKFNEINIAISRLSVDLKSLASEASGAAASIVMSDVLKLCYEESQLRNLLCPIRANIENLLTDGGVDRWRILLRSAEVAAGRLLTYRDLWGLISLSIVGPRPVGGEVPEHTLKEIDRVLDICSSATGFARLRGMIWLSQFRNCSSLFRVPLPLDPAGTIEYPSSTPYQIGFSYIDPALWGALHSQAVEDAMAALSIGERPSECLNEQLAHVWSSFDQQLEETVLTFIQADECQDTYRRTIITWFSGYLSRLVAMGSGKYGNEETVIVLENLTSGLNEGQVSRIPEQLEQPLRSLIFPVNDSGSKYTMRIAAFAARAEPVNEARAERAPILVEEIDHASVAVRLRKSGGRALLECTLAGSDTVLGQLLLDFLMVREALASKGGSAQTDATAFIEPRLERCRSSTINQLSSTQRSLASLSSGGLEEISL